MTYSIALGVQKLLQQLAVLNNTLNRLDLTTELTWLWFIKIASAWDMAFCIPATGQWQVLRDLHEPTLLPRYQATLSALANSQDPQVAAIYRQARTQLQTDAQVMQIITALDTLDTFAAEEIGVLYNQLLQQQGLAAPHALEDALVTLTQPALTTRLLDPLCGAGTLLVASTAYMQLEYTEALESPHTSLPPEPHVLGLEQNLAFYRLASFNALLHYLPILQTLPVQQQTWSEHNQNADYDCIISCLHQPHFSLKQEAVLLEQCINRLPAQGRLALLVSDALLNAPAYQTLRQRLLDEGNLHTLLRLPCNLFYPIKDRCHALFWHKNATTDKVWFYDLRQTLLQLSAHRSLQRSDLNEFCTLFGDISLDTVRTEQSNVWFAVARSVLATELDDLDYCGRHISLENNAGALWAMLEEVVQDLKQLGSVLKN